MFYFYTYLGVRADVLAGMAMGALTSTRSTLPSRGVVFGVYKHVSHRVRVNALVAIPASTPALASRYEALTTLSLSVAISLASLVILFTATDAPTFFTLVKPGGASGVVLANTHVVSATTLLGPCGSTFHGSQYFRYPGAGYAVMQWDKPPAQAA